MKLLPLILAAILASCAGPTPDPAPSRTFQPSRQGAEISGSAAEVDRSATAVRREADALREQVGTLRHAASEATRSARTARSELDRLTEQKSATESELLQLGVLFKDLEQRNMFLEAEVETLAESHEMKLREAVEDMQATVVSLQKEAGKKDAEVAELRQLLKSANDHNDILQSDNERLAKSAQKAEVGQASAKTYRNILIWSAIGLFIALLLFVAIRTGLVSIVGR